MSHTEGPWSWAYMGEKTNGYVIGVACDLNGKQLAGLIHDRDDMVDELLYKYCVGEHEASTVNYADAKLICAAPELLEALDTIANKPIGDAEATCRDVLSEIVTLARAAISKATGETR